MLLKTIAVDFCVDIARLIGITIGKCEADRDALPPELWRQLQDPGSPAFPVVVLLYPFVIEVPESGIELALRFAMSNRM